MIAAERVNRSTTAPGPLRLVECLALRDIMVHPLTEAARLGSATLTEISIETFTKLPCIPAVTAAAITALPVSDTLLDRILSLRCDESFARVLAPPLQLP